MIAIFPEIAGCVHVKDLERLAVLIRQYYGGEQERKPQINLRRVFANIGIDVQELPIKDEATILAKDETGSFTVTVVLSQNERSAAEENFLLAHLLGHFLFHIQPFILKGDWRTGGFREVISPLKRFSGEANENKIDSELLKEKEADEFAAALILPKGMLLRAYEKLANLEKIGRFFGTTSGCVEARLSSFLAAPEMPPVAPSNFSEAETRLTEEKKFNVEAAVATSKKEKLLSDNSANDGLKMPKSFAASTYHRTQKTTSKVENASEVKKLSPEQAKSKAETGLAKLRRLAKKIDGSVGP